MTKANLEAAVRYLIGRLAHGARVHIQSHGGVYHCEMPVPVKLERHPDRTTHQKTVSGGEVTSEVIEKARSLGLVEAPKECSPYPSLVELTDRGWQQAPKSI